MEDTECFIKILQQKRLLNQRELERLDVEPDEHKELMRELQELKNENEQCTANIIKHLNMITAHKHKIIHKIINSSKDISGLPVPHDYAQHIKTMFVDVIEFLNNVHTYEAINDVQKNNVDPLKLIQAVTRCIDAIANVLCQTKYSIDQLETLKENMVVLEQMLENANNDTGEGTSSICNSESTDSNGSIIK